ncbi:MAG: carboxylating nicotinate-nucleotide diphosphorylase [Candidatus Marinimicrobia bacterium]|nr:carboxylating nicotinate-nucleotide diphosphorylase [Candidatus Neomarinimicrobiota bacterium]
MDNIDIEHLKERIHQALEEDIRTGDITTQCVTEFSPHAQAEIVAKQDGILAGISVAELVFTSLEPPLDVVKKSQDGEEVTTGQQLLTLEGSGATILQAERLALNLLGRLSGIATLTRQYVDSVNGTNAKILDTRKTTPLWRDLEKYAVRMGGGKNHRMGLYDMVLIKENHIRWAGGITPALEQCMTFLKSRDMNVKVEIEVTDLKELQEALNFPVDRVLLDNMSPQEVSEAADINAGRAQLEVSGGITLNSIRDFAETGIDYISIGALTHSVSSFDLSLLFLTENLQPGELAGK